MRTYLGRPWRAFAAVLFMNSEMTDVVLPAGWQNWEQPSREKTSRFAEFNNHGPGSGPAGRVAWAATLTATEAQSITPNHILAGRDHWSPATP